MFVVTLTALNMHGAKNVTMSVIPDDGGKVVLTVKPGETDQATITNLSGPTFAFDTTLEVDGGPKAAARVEQATSEGGFYVQVVVSALHGKRPVGVGYVSHSIGHTPVLICKGPPQRKQTCPGSLNCDDYILTC